jgi:hypothetical protein
VGSDREPTGGIRVTTTNFIRAETDMYFGRFVGAVGLAAFAHSRDVTDVSAQTVVRMNRDTLYSPMILDLDSGPATITLPDAGARFRSMQIIDEDHFTSAVHYDAGSYALTREEIGTRYVCALIRTFVDPSLPGDLDAVHALQDATVVEQADHGAWGIPAWDDASRTAIRDALSELATANGEIDASRTFGRRDEVDPVDHLIGSAVGWGGNPVSDAAYRGFVVERNDGTVPHRLVLGNVPVDAFWSVSVYNADGFFEPNPQEAYTVNNVSAARADDGSVTIRFGGTPEASPNWLAICPGWNYLIRLYRPRREIIDGSWKPPLAEPTD